MSSPFRRMSGRHRVISATSALILVVLSVAILRTPTMRQALGGPSGPSRTEIQLKEQRARADDLKRQLDAAEVALTRPRPQSSVDTARADDLKRQLQEANRKLADGDPPSQVTRTQTRTISDGQRARADDLKRQLNRALAQLRTPKSSTPTVVKAALTKQQIIDSRKLFGLYTAQAPFNYSEVGLVQDGVARDADIVGYFQSWATGFRPDAVRSAWSRGDIPLMTWESQDQVGASSAIQPKFSMPKIIAGEFDDYLHTYARDIAETQLPLIIRFDHEMNGTWYPWSESNLGTPINGNNRGDYVRMWRHVHDIFQAEDANRYVVWLWAPNRVDGISTQDPVSHYYPGDQYVDWAGLSGYYRPKNRSTDFAGTFNISLAQVRLAAAGKPIILAEIGCTEDNGNKVKWINDLFLGLKANPDVVGFAWFNFAITNNGNTNDWRINSTRASREAFAAAIKSAGYGKPRVNAAS